MKEIPRISYDHSKELGIEVMDFNQLLFNLKKSRNHSPFKVHRIEFFLILIVTKGHYSHMIDFKTYDLEVGNMLFIAKNQVHSFSNTLENTAGYCIIFNDLFADKRYLLLKNLQLNRLFNYHIESPTLLMENLEDSSLEHVIELLHVEYNFSTTFSKADILQSLLLVLLLKADRAKEHTSTKQVNNRWLEVFGQFKNILESGYVIHRNSRVYASQLLISYKTLNEVVKEFTGKTAKSFIDDFVTIEIKRYLASTTLSIKEISYKTGFDEPSNLVKFFKRHTGITPLQFKSRM